MLFKKIAPMLACLCFLALRRSDAQTPSTSFSQSLTATSGLSFGQHLDASSSPIPFSGNGIEGRLRYERFAGRWDATIAADAARHLYTSRADAGTSVRERAFDGALTATLVRDLHRDSVSAFGAGLALDIQGGLLTHRYADPAATTTDYVNGYALVGPAVRWRHTAFGGATTLRLSVPLFGMAHHGYSDARLDQAAPTFSGVGPRTLRAYDASVGFESSTARRIGFIGEFRVHALDYADLQRARTASTSLTAGIVLRFGKSRP